jgi:cytochrome o ubiquinol oxidase subunit 2
LAWEPGKFVGRNSQYSGSGFAQQYFDVVSASQDDFDAWLEKVRQSSEALNAASYAELAKPSRKHPVTYYSSYEDGLYDSIVAKYMHAPGMEHGAVTVEEN